MSINNLQNKYGNYNNNEENINGNEIEKPGKKLSDYRNISYSKRDIFIGKQKKKDSELGPYIN